MMMGTALASGFFISQTGVLWIRSLAYCTACSRAAEAWPKPWMPTSRRASFIMWNMIRMPWRS